MKHSLYKNLRIQFNCNQTCYFFFFFPNDEKICSLQTMMFLIIVINIYLFACRQHDRFKNIRGFMINTVCLLFGRFVRVIMSRNPKCYLPKDEVIMRVIRKIKSYLFFAIMNNIIFYDFYGREKKLM